MIPTKINGQVLVSRETWNEAMDAVGDYYKDDYYITDFDYGGGYYRIVMSKNIGWNGQIIRYGKDFPQEAIKEGWDKGYHITNLLHDGSDWIVIMSGVPGCLSQQWFTRTGWVDFKDEISRIWNEDMVLTKVACRLNPAPNVYCGVASKMNISQGQKYNFFPGGTPKDIMALCVEGNKITDIYDFEGGVVAITTTQSGWSKQVLLTGPNWEGNVKTIKEYWDKGYNVTTMCYYNNMWYIIVSY